MSNYEELSEVETVALGGVNKTTGVKNPTELEGYLIRVEKRPNKFNPEKPQNFYVFLTPEGEKGVFGKAGVNRVLRNAVFGAMTKLVSTGEVLDTGKGNPMKVFKAYQDKSNTIDPDLVSIATAVESDNYEETEGEELEEAPTFPRAAKAPSNPLPSPSAARVQQTRELLKKRVN